MDSKRHRLAILRGIESPYALTERVGPVVFRQIVIVVSNAMVVVQATISALAFTSFASDPVAT